MVEYASCDHFDNVLPHRAMYQIPPALYYQAVFRYPVMGQTGIPVMLGVPPNSPPADTDRAGTSSPLMDSSSPVAIAKSGANVAASRSFLMENLLRDEIGDPASTSKLQKTARTVPTTLVQQLQKNHQISGGQYENLFSRIPALAPIDANQDVRDGVNNTQSCENSDNSGHSDNGDLKFGVNNILCADQRRRKYDIDRFQGKEIIIIYYYLILIETIDCYTGL